MIAHSYHHFTEHTTNTELINPLKHLWLSIFLNVNVKFKNGNRYYITRQLIWLKACVCVQTTDDEIVSKPSGRHLKWHYKYTIKTNIFFDFRPAFTLSLMISWQKVIVFIFTLPVLQMALIALQWCTRVILKQASTSQHTPARASTFILGCFLDFFASEY